MKLQVAINSGSFLRDLKKAAYKLELRLIRPNFTYAPPWAAKVRKFQESSASIQDICVYTATEALM